MKQVLLLLVCITTITSVQGQGPTTGPREYEAAKTLAETLEGRDLTVRIYPDPASDPDKSTLAQVPVRRRTIEFSAVESAYPGISESAYILIQATDQTDQDVSAALDRYVCLISYETMRSFPVSLLDAFASSASMWTFFDAQGEPMAGASVALELRPFFGRSDAPPIHMETGRLDEQGRLASWQAVGELTIRVEHPDYGIATVCTVGGPKDRAGIYVVPLVPRDSEAFSSSLSGIVTDSNGQPVADVPVSFSLTGLSQDDNDCYNRLFDGRAVTNEQGWFALCRPKLSKELVLGELPGPGTPYVVRIDPPKALNLRYLVASIYTGTPSTPTLTAMDAQEVFRTFSFEYYDGPVTNPDELAGMTLTLQRDGRAWRTLTFDQFANGCYLPLGTLSARTTRWGRPFHFISIELNTDSPEHLVFATHAPVVYRGRVVEFGTNRPIAGAFVLAEHSLARTEPAALTAEQWQRLAAQAKIDGATEEALHQERDRVAITDADGTFEIVSVSMAGRSRLTRTNLFDFTALAPGYARRAVRSPSGSDFDIISVPTIELSRPGTAYFPEFVFEDETGVVTDPDKLDKIRLSIARDNGSTNLDFRNFLDRKAFIPGDYLATVAWNGKWYTFAPVDLTTARPSTVVFRPMRIERMDVVYRGRVIDAVTGAPIRGAIAVCTASPAPPGVKGLRPEEWAAIEALEPDPDLNDPAFARLRLVGSTTRQDPSAILAISNREGWFQIEVKHSAPGAMNDLWVLAPDYLIRYEVFWSGNGRGPEKWPMPVPRFPADETGVATLPTFSLVPAASVTLHPVIPDPGRASSGVLEPMFYWGAPPEEPAQWVNRLPGTPLAPNRKRTVLVPAGVTLRLKMDMAPTSGLLGVALPTVRLEKGQTQDLGRVEFSSGIPIVVRVIDGAGRPLENAVVSCMDEDMWVVYFRNGRTDEYGVASINAPAHSTGRIRASMIDPLTGTRIEESIPFQIGGQEDTGKEFILALF